MRTQMQMTHKARSSFMVMSVLGLIACGSLTKKDAASDDGTPSTNLTGGTGCVHGSIVNGLTGESIAVRSFDGNLGVSILVRDQLVGAGGIGGSSAKELMEGQYAVCGIPTDEDYTLYVRQEGYQLFNGTVRIESTTAPKGPSIKTHLFKAQPAIEANIVLYPIGTKTQDLSFTVVYAGLPVKNASVQLRPTGRNALDAVSSKGADEQSFETHVLPPRDLRFKTLTAVTDDNGVATFGKGDLVLGGVYKYLVMPPENLTTASTEVDGTGTVIVGLQTTGTGRDPYRYSAVLRPMAAELAVLQTSAQSQSTSPDGSVSIVFNRAVEIVSPADSMVASLSNAVDAELVAEVPYNMAADTMDIKLSNDGTVLRLTPKFKTQPNSAREPALAITYAGFQVRPANAPFNAKVLAVSGQTVKLFGADVNPALVARKLTKGANADNQQATVNTLLSQPVSLTIVDQFGLGLKNQTVTFTVQSGGGSLKKLNDTSFQTSITVVTDVNGVASVQWSLGSSVGAQTVQAKLASGALDPVVFTATATAN